MKSDVTTYLHLSFPWFLKTEKELQKQNKTKKTKTKKKKKKKKHWTKPKQTMKKKNNCFHDLFYMLLVENTVDSRYLDLAYLE